MEWKEYCAGLDLLTKRFGAYPKQEIEKGYRFWKNKEQNFFIEEIEMSLSTGARLQLDQPKLYRKPPYFQPFALEEKFITDDYLINLLKENEVESLLELVFKQKKERP